ncbi:PHB depolymerase family esterase [Acidovorax sp. LjRoot118]|uniref:extracellular catalytic domain type 1 short-chain-length polyhydroxyalkanoate depolymerase n=1 Tax=Acidovorax sp. LjRoot118 TaxID=3342256 RepID=UPI003ED08586
MDWNPHFKKLLGNATDLVRNGQLADATRAIQQALGGAMAGPATATAPHAGATLRSETAQQPPAAARPGPSWRTGFAGADVEDVAVIDLPAEDAASAPTSRSEPSAPSPRKTPTGRPAELPGSFTRVAFALAGAPQDHYYLYVPPGASAGAPMPLVLMLHGCTQNPEDFALGTGMNTAAAPANALVLYPAQPQSANPNGCWNWFRPQDQQRGAGEPAVLVAMVREVMARHPVDAQRVYVAGLSAGGAMAALLGREYPELFAAVGVHSGLQAGAANNVMGALSAMKNGAKLSGASPFAPAPPPVQTGATPPVIVFHGDADATVHARNGEQLVEAALAGATGAVQEDVRTGRSASGQGYTRTVYRAGNAMVAEHWVLHGGGHAWAGGDARGSHTDPRGVSAAQEMLRFFLEHPRG